MAPRISSWLHESVAGTSVTSGSTARRRPNLSKEGSYDVQDDIKSICSQSVSIQVDVQDEEAEIPIWICGAPRYVSGILDQTTCNDVIQALIDDEIRFIDDIGQGNCLSRDCRDYVITEKWRDIEQVLPGETYILPIWNEWGVAQNEVKFKLKINKMKEERTGQVDTSETKKQKPSKGKKMHAISKLIQKVIKQGEVIHNQLSKYRPNSSNNKAPSKKCKHSKDFEDVSISASFFHDHQKYFSLPRRRDENNENDEILLVLHPNEEDKDSGINIHPGLPRDIQALDSVSEASFRQTHEDTLRLSYPKLGRFAKKEFVCSTPHSASRRRKSLQFNVIRNEIVETTQGIDDLMYEERRLARHLAKKRLKYRAENELYKTKEGLEVCIDEIQANLATYGKEIVESELDLYKIKQEIQHKCILLSNLKRMLDGSDATKYQSFRYNKQSCRFANKSGRFRRVNSMQFVDNVYEFCDNNGSLVV